MKFVFAYHFHWLTWIKYTQKFTNWVQSNSFLSDIQDLWFFKIQNNPCNSSFSFNFQMAMYYRIMFSKKTTSKFKLKVYENVFKLYLIQTLLNIICKMFGKKILLIIKSSMREANLKFQQRSAWNNLQNVLISSSPLKKIIPFIGGREYSITQCKVYTNTP